MKNLMNPESRLDLAKVRSQREVSSGFFWLQLELPKEYPEMLPGQYLNLKTHAALFRRPFGVVEFTREDHCSLVELFYAVVGEGTKEMSTWVSGDQIDCLGPLGTPYHVAPSQPAVLIAGGRGAAPLLFLYRLLKEQQHQDVSFAFGVRSESFLFGLDRLDDEDLLVASDDGSCGHHGTVLQVIEKQQPSWLEANPVLYVCGPEALLAAAGQLAVTRNLSCQVSLEGVYGCGLGLCRGCAVPVRGQESFVMQCIEGPVIDANRIDWERMPHA